MSISLPRRHAAFLGAIGLLAGGAAWPLAGCTLSCTEVGCTSEVSARVHIDAPPARIADGTIQVCHQDFCATARATARGDSPTSWTLSLGSGEVFIRGQLEAEGSGSLLQAYFVRGSRKSNAGTEDLDDGDPIRIRVTDHDGSVLAEHARLVTYTASSPNGEACGPTCRGAVVELWPASVSGAACPSSGICQAGLDLSTSVKATREIRGLTTLKVCRNAECRSADVDLSSSGMLNVGEPGAHPWTASHFFKEENGAYDLRIHLDGDTRELRNGDRYTVDWQARESGVPVFVLDELVTYDESQPGGPACMPTPCRSQALVR